MACYFLALCLMTCFTSRSDIVYEDSGLYLIQVYKETTGCSYADI